MTESEWILERGEILTRLERLENDVHDIRSWMLERNGVAPAAQIADEIARRIGKRDSGQIRKSDLEAAIRKVRENGGSKSGLQSWQWLLLGAALVAPQVVIEIIRMSAGA